MLETKEVLILRLLDLGSFAVTVRCERSAEEPFFLGQVGHLLSINLKNIYGCTIHHIITIINRRRLETMLKKRSFTSTFNLVEAQKKLPAEDS